MIDQSNRRLYQRHNIRHQVFFKNTSTNYLAQQWHIGETQNISMGGMMIKSNNVSDFLPESKLLLLCPPKKIELGICVSDSEPLWINADLVWKDDKNNCIGVKIVS